MPDEQHPATQSVQLAPRRPVVLNNEVATVFGIVGVRVVVIYVGVGFVARNCGSITRNTLNSDVG
jgi:hypothetical protein